MIKHRLKNYIKLGTLLFSISLFFSNCSNTEKIEEKVSFLKGFKYGAFNDIKNITSINQSTSKILTSKGIFSKSDGKQKSNSYEFTIDTSLVQTIESKFYVSYTFIAITDELDSTKLHNYVITKYNDGRLHEMLVAYPIIGSESNYSLDMQNISAYPVLDGNLSFISKNSTYGKGTDPIGDCDLSNGYATDEWVVTCVDYDCSVGGGDGSHSTGDACDNGEQIAYTECTGAWVTTCSPYEDDGSNGNPYNDPNTPGGDGDSDEEPDENDIATLPLTKCKNPEEVDIDGNCIPETIEDLGKKKECKKITGFLNNTENEAFKDKLNELSSPANLNLNKEKAVSSFENETALDEREGTSDKPAVSILDNPTNKYKALAHTHPNIGTGTLSVFSVDDLITIAKLINNNKISDDFVAFLTTKKGTQYALTIQNPTKFLDFFYSQIFNNVSEAIATDPINTFTISDRFYNSLDIYQPIYDEYFDPNNNERKIKRTDTESNDVLKEFLDFMDKANAGFTLFDASSTSPFERPFTTFRKLSLKNGEPQREKPCI